MSLNPPSSLGTSSNALKQRYRLPGIIRKGIAQLSILETALWPVQGGKRNSLTFDTQYKYSVDKKQQQAQVSVYAPLGLESIDEYILWGLLGMSLSHKQPDPTFLATPYWIIKNLGMSIGGSQYTQLRASLERLALVAYQNTAFYNPVTQEHERVTFHFFSCFLPTRDRGASVDNERSWRIEWSPTFFKMCQATGGTLLFDLDLYRELTPAARRLFLKLKDRFWRTKRVFMNVDDLTINGLGLSPDRPLKKRKFDLGLCIQELIDHGVIELGKGQSHVKDLFIKRGKGLYVVQFFEGPYFRRPLSQRKQGAKESIIDDPLFQPLKNIGVDEAGIRRLFKECSRGVLQRWIKITDVAMHEHPRGFQGSKLPLPLSSSTLSKTIVFHRIGYMNMNEKQGDGSGMKIIKQLPTMILHCKCNMRGQKQSHSNASFNRKRGVSTSNACTLYFWTSTKLSIRMERSQSHAKRPTTRLRRST